jgi:PKD repeat protein
MKQIGLNIKFWQFAFLAIAFLYFLPESFSQSVALSKVQASTNSPLNKVFYDYKLVRIQYDQLKSAMSSRGNEHFIHLQGPDLDWKLQLFNHDVHSGDYILKLGTDRGVQTLHRKPANASLIGYLNSKRGGQARIVVADNYLAGMVEQGGLKYFIEPASRIDPSLPFDYLIIYNTDDIIQNTNIECGFDLYRHHLKNFQEQNKKNTNTDRSNCVLTEIAISNDYTVFQKWGSVAAVENWNITILTLMVADFDNEFQKSIEFEQTASFIATSPSGDPWFGINDINAQLNKHQFWGSSGGYGAEFDVAVNWTCKYTTGVIGVAWGLNFVCTNFSYVVCSDYGAGNGCLRQLQSHEIGHIFGAWHDGNGDPFIMAPKSNCTSVWSPVSISTINAGLPTYFCLTPCGGFPPECDFVASVTEGCVAFNVQFTDLSTYDPIAWQWTFPGGIPSTSKISNPVVQYKTYGKYDVTLKVTNNAGSSTLTFKEYIFANKNPVADFTKQIKGRSVSFTSTSVYADTHEWDFGDGQSSFEANPTHVYLDDGAYDVVLKVVNDCGFSDMKIKINIVTSPVAQFSSDTTRGCGTFNVKFVNLSTKNVNSWTWEFPGGTPSSSTQFEPMVEYKNPGVYDVKLTAKNSLFESTVEKPKYITVDTSPVAAFDIVINRSTVYFTNQSQYGIQYKWDFGDGTFSDEVSPEHQYSSDGDYIVKMISGNTCGYDTIIKTIAVYLIPKVDFGSDTTVVCANGNIQFASKSSSDVHTWSWQFDGGIPAASDQKDPIVTYPNKGIYSVKLKVQNSNGENELVKQDYIKVISSVLCLEFVHNSKDTLNRGDVIDLPDVNRFDKSVIYMYLSRANLSLRGISKAEVVQIRIFDLTGRVVFTEFMEVINDSYHSELNLDYLNQGIYLINLSSARNNFTKAVFLSK